jgi:hypothetical protein
MQTDKYNDDFAISLRTRVMEMGRDSSVGIATRYELDVRGSYLVGDEIFSTCPDWPWGLSSLMYNGYRVWGKLAGAWRLPPTRMYRRG